MKNVAHGREHNRLLEMLQARQAKPVLSVEIIPLAEVPRPIEVNAAQPRPRRPKGVPKPARAR